MMDLQEASALLGSDFRSSDTRTAAVPSTAAFSSGPVTCLRFCFGRRVLGYLIAVQVMMCSMQCDIFELSRLLTGAMTWCTVIGNPANKIFNTSLDGLNLENRRTSLSESAQDYDGTE